MREIDLLKTDPKALLVIYMGILNSGETLTETQLIFLETITNMMDIQGQQDV